MPRFAVVAALLLAATGGAAAQVPDQPAAAPASAPPSGSGLVLGAGIDYRYVYNYFYFYASPSGGYSETESTIPSVAVEAAWHFQVAPRLTIAPGAGLAFGAGNADFASALGAPEMTSYSATTYHAEAFGEADFEVVSGFALLGRLGVGVTGVDLDPAADGASSLFVAVGARLGLGPRLGVAALYQSTFSPSGWTDAGVTSADPTLDGYEGWALQARLLYRL